MHSEVRRPGPAGVCVRHPGGEVLAPAASPGSRLRSGRLRSRCRMRCAALPLAPVPQSPPCPCPTGPFADNFKVGFVGALVVSAAISKQQGAGAPAAEPETAGLVEVPVAVPATTAVAAGSPAGEGNPFLEGKKPTGERAAALCGPGRPGRGGSPSLGEGRAGQGPAGPCGPLSLPAAPGPLGGPTCRPGRPRRPRGSAGNRRLLEEAAPAPEAAKPLDKSISDAITGGMNEAAGEP